MSPVVSPALSPQPAPRVATVCSFLSSFWASPNWRWECLSYPSQVHGWSRTGFAFLAPGSALSGLSHWHIVTPLSWLWDRSPLAWQVLGFAAKNDRFLSMGSNTWYFCKDWELPLQRCNHAVQAQDRVCPRCLVRAPPVLKSHGSLLALLSFVSWLFIVILSLLSRFWDWWLYVS